MFDISLFIKAALIYSIALVTPGADFAITIANSIKSSRKTALYSAVGTASGIACHLTYTLLGLAMIIREFPQLFTTIQMVGAGYLCFLGITNLRNAQKQRDFFDQAYNAISASVALRRAFFVNISNPMVMVFFISVFSEILTPHTSHFEKVLLIFEIVLIDFSWYSSVAFCFSHKKVQELFNKHITWVERITGMTFIILGIKLSL